jgi:hypothetical protein
LARRRIKPRLSGIVGDPDCRVELADSAQASQLNLLALIHLNLA